MTEALVLGTRGSRLALAQSQLVADMVTAELGLAVRLEVISTRGDRIVDRPLAAVGGKGLFTAELEAGLRSGEIHLAVHSLKDLPTEDAAGLINAAIPLRADPRDALVGSTLDSLPPGAVVGTGSARRRAQLLRLRPDLDIRGIRGNVDTRLRKLDSGEYAAIVLAMAGLARLGLERSDVYPLSISQMIPAAGQGALAVQCRADNQVLRTGISRIEDQATRRCVDAERAFLQSHGGGCHSPVAAHAWLENGEITLRVGGLDQSGWYQYERRGPEGISLGRALSEQLSEQA